MLMPSAILEGSRQITLHTVVYRGLVVYGNHKVGARLESTVMGAKLERYTVQAKVESYSHMKV
ncbi:hypothetical protein JYU34_001216 [Plutella xylostella]|uniref:Uncharacterized protein n=1 Tax=Plutella xylostella TaxID=51655 RepID=A0ABQ7R6A8_PLUXY|nr:hypothetical protein JYU34_001216 [Plutella xylostella]